MADFKKAKVGYEDFFWDTNGTDQTFSREDSEGNNINIKGINAGHIPLLSATRTLSLYDTDVLSSDDVDEAITEIAASLNGVHKFSNQSILDQITSAGSGAIMTVSERSKLNSITDVGSGEIITAAERSKLSALAALTDEQIAFLQNIDTLSVIGSIMMYPVETVPNKFLECDGRELSRTTYADLFGVIGTLYGVGDGSTTFNIPDYRGRFLRGWDHGAGNDPDAASRTDAGDGSTTGDEVGTQQDDEVGPHYHDIIVKTSGGLTEILSGASATSAGYSQTENNSGSESRPKNVNVVFCIRYEA